MKWLLIFLIGVLVYKDVSHLLILDRYVLRGSMQGVALIVGLVWLATYFSREVTRRYWPAFLYIFSLSMSLFMASDVFNSSMQVLSVSAIILFSVAYTGSTRARSIEYPMAPLIYSTAILFSIIFFVGLILNMAQPEMVYERMHSGAMRFRGVFGEPAILGEAAGLAIGMALFGIKNKWLKFIVLGLAIPSLMLTFSRTFVIATFFSGLVTIWFYYPRLKKIAMGVFVVGLMFVAVVLLLDLNVKVDTQERREIVRADSIQSMSGRTAIWERAFDTYLESPIIGHGFTLGVNAVFGGWHGDEISVFDAGKKISSGFTLHSGYVQALVDLGTLGFVAYIIFIFLPILRLRKYDVNRKYAAEFYILNLLWVGNLAENTIYSGGSFISGIFWVVAVFGLSIRPVNGGKAVRSRI